MLHCSWGKKRRIRKNANIFVCAFLDSPLSAMYRLHKTIISLLTHETPADLSTFYSTTMHMFAIGNLYREILLMKWREKKKNVEKHKFMMHNIPSLLFHRNSTIRTPQKAPLHTRCAHFCCLQSPFLFDVIV